MQAKTEEFAAALLGWPVRTFEAAVPPEKLGWGWARFAFGGWKSLSWLDEKVLQHVVPRGFFYNVMITGVKPARPPWTAASGRRRVASPAPAPTGGARRRRRIDCRRVRDWPTSAGRVRISVTALHC